MQAGGNADAVFERVRAIIVATHERLTLEDVRRSASLTGDLGMDSFHLESMIAALKDEVLRQRRKQVELKVLELAGLRPDRIVFVGPRALPKTTSGKIRRALVRDNIAAFEDQARAFERA